MTGDHSDLPEILSHVDPATCDYSTWVSVGMALKAAGLAVDVWDNWSRLDPERYHVGECESKWDTFGDGGEGMVGPGSMALARERGWEPEGRGVDRAFGGDDEVTIDFVEDAPAVGDDVAVDGAQAVSDLSAYLAAVFKPNEHIGYVVSSDDEGRPRGKGNYTRTAAELERALDHEATKVAPDIANVIGDWNHSNGAWIRVNPLSGNGVRNSDVTDFRHVLVESDSMDPGKQLKFLQDSMLPIAAIVSSANKSVHAIVRVDAPSKAEYTRRVEFLFKWLRARGFEVDTQNKNPSRLSRIPGVTRGDRYQKLLGTNKGLPTWEAWEEWAIGEDDGLPDMESLASVWEDLPPLSEPLIDGVLRRGHKMLLAGPSKAGKSYALIELAIAIAEGVSWLGWPCKRGRVLYVNLELDRASCLQRFRDVYDALGIPQRSIASIDVWNLRGHAAPMKKIAPRLINRAAKKNYDLIIIDPIYKVIEGDENSAGDMARFCNAFDEIATSLGCAVAYCHHHSKGLQGQKHSMDRASGSGVFARDPDALLDMSPLDVSDEEMAKRIPDAVKGACLAEIERHAPWAMGDDLRSKAPADLRKIADEKLASDEQRQALGKRIDSIRMATPWRIEGTLREFPAFEPRDLWFEHPLHIVDDGSLKGAEVAGDYAGAMTRSQHIEKNKKAKREREMRAHQERVNAIREAIEECEREGLQPTRENVLDWMPEVNDRAVSMRQLKEWTRPAATWCPYGLGKGGLVTKVDKAKPQGKPRKKEDKQ